jgi:hypothetical protein
VNGFGNDPDDTISSFSGLEAWLFSALGFVMVLIPLGLWVSWTEQIFYGLLLAWVAAYAAVAFLCKRGPSNIRSRQ